MTRNTLILLAVFVVLGIFAVSVHRRSEAEMYKYVDENGKIHFTNSPRNLPRDANKVEVQKKRPKMKTVKSEVEKKAASRKPDVKSEKTSKKVIVYMTDWCGYCRRTMAWLDSRGVPYEAKNIEKSFSARREYQRKGGDGGVPLVDIGGRIIMGYSEQRMLEALGR